jgi:hypothetical protein
MRHMQPPIRPAGMAGAGEFSGLQANEPFDDM